ncbi:amino acid ABC transporter permease [Maridesulfovibrio ferrireducens]|uniref:amino acid ABC transporter permease n=1 Tax=Maridesulfovibrio ferrireducens TaxID=246191 RepID=UPI001A33E3D1|nr:amino acid ABC transporter permease [Maridesulfovibrio ferrireducens]MBI9111454.1 amino acid ABC transporter permease [Maridesulfovibrio ferrireducens]
MFKNNSINQCAQKRRLFFGDLFLFILLLAVGSFFLYQGTEKLGYNWQWFRIPDFIFTYSNHEFISGPLLKGLLVTLKITGLGFVLTFIIGLGTAILRLSDSFVGNSIARLYLEIVRNTPLLIQLFFIYFVVSPILNISGFWSAVIALSLFEGAYASEIFRSGITSIDKGQWEAAFSLGGNTKFAYMNVILPQAIPRIAPPLAGQAIALVKDSALVSTVAIYDLTMQGQSIISETFLTFEIWFTVAAAYLVVTLLLSWTLDRLAESFKSAW